MQPFSSSLAQTFLAPTAISLVNTVRSALDSNKQLQDAVATQHGVLACFQRLLDENLPSLRDNLDGAQRFLGAMSAPDALSPSWSHALAGLSAYVDPHAEIPPEGSPARVYPGQFLVLAFDYDAHIATNIGTTLGNIVAAPTEAHPDEVSFLVNHWPAVSNTLLILAHLAGLSRMFREYNRFTNIQYTQLSRIKMNVNRECPSSCVSSCSGLEALYAAIHPFTTDYATAVAVPWEFGGALHEAHPFRTASVHRADCSIPYSTRDDAVKNVLDKQSNNADIYSQSGSLLRFALRVLPESTSTEVMTLEA